MSYLIKSLMCAGALGLGAATLGTSVAEAKPPVAVSISADQKTDGHYETYIEYETRVDSDGNTYTVPVERKVWVSDTFDSAPYYYDGPRYYGPSFRFNWGGGHWGHHHHH